MLGRSDVHAVIPAADLARARAFYTEVLGLSPRDEDEFMITFPTPNGSWFQVYETAFAGTGQHTIAQWDVTDLEQEVKDLKSRGVVFETYDMPGVEWHDEIATMEGLRTAWFRDSEDNILCLDEIHPGS